MLDTSQQEKEELTMTQITRLQEKPRKEVYTPFEGQESASKIDPPQAPRTQAPRRRAPPRGARAASLPVYLGTRARW